MSSPEHPRKTVAAGWRFLIVGGSNTIATAALLVALSYLMQAWLAYTLAFGTGLVYSTIFASRWVFTRVGSRRATLRYALCYIVIYFVGLGCVAVIRSWGWPEFLNVLSVLVTAPLGFLAGRLVFRERQREETVNE